MRLALELRNPIVPDLPVRVRTQTGGRAIRLRRTTVSGLVDLVPSHGGSLPSHGGSLPSHGGSRAPKGLEHISPGQSAAPPWVIMITNTKP